MSRACIGYLRRNAFSERNSAATNADEKQVARAMVLFHDFRRQTGKRTVDTRTVHDASLLDEIHLRGY